MFSTRLIQAILFTLAAALLPAAQAAAQAQTVGLHSHSHEAHHALHEHNPDLDEIVVTVSGAQRSRYELVRGTQTLNQAELRSGLQSTLGAALANESGVAASGFAPGASRPIIRGLDGPRLRVLQNSVGVMDVSVSSPDHQVVADPLAAKRVEVLRGAGTLRYGSNAIGGVVNVLDDRIATKALPDAWEGGLHFQHGDNQGANSGSAALRANAGPFVLRLNGFARDAGDLHIRGDALSAFAQEEAREHAHEEEEGHDEDEDHDEDEHEEEEHHDEEEEPDDPLYGIRGYVPNTGLESAGGGFGATWVGENAHFGIAVSTLESEYGVPLAHEEHGHEEEEDHEEEEGHEEGEDHDEDEDEHGHAEEGAEDIRIDLEQQRLDFGGEVRGNFGPFSTLGLRGGYGDYEHSELEGSTVGTVFRNKGAEVRLEAVQAERELAGGMHSGLLGAHFRREKRDAEGAEAFIPEHTNEQWALFAVQTLQRARFTLDGGARVERSDIETVDGRDRSYTTWSASVDAAYALTPDTSLGLSLSRSERPPLGEELFSDGPHFATAAYEVGEAGLESETSWSMEVSAKRRIGDLSGGVNLFATRFDDFIFHFDTGREEDGLPVRQFAQRDAVFRGLELEADWELFESPWGKGALHFGYDITRGRESDGAALPRITPARARSAFTLRGERADFKLEAVTALKQSKVAANERPTAGYTVVNAALTWRPLREYAFALLLQGRNLGDRRGRNHLSYLKDRLPIAGRDLRVGVKLDF